MRRGNYSIFFAIVVAVMFGFGALAIDLTYIQLASMEAQALADSASHAAFVAYRKSLDTDAADTAVAHVLSRNTIMGRTAALQSLEFGEWDQVTGAFDTAGESTNAARVRLGLVGADALDLVLAPMIGFGTTEISAVSITSGRTREIMLVQDITGSFVDDIDEAREADLAFLDTLLLSPYPGDRIGMSTFVGGVAPDPWTALQDLDTAGATIRSQWQTLDSCNCNAYPDDQWWCETYYGAWDGSPQMQDCFAYGYQTAQGPGIDQAVAELTTNGSPLAFQAIILVSDGLPCCDDLTQPRREHALQAVDDAWSAGIHVWTVTFMNGGGDFSFLASLARGQGQAYLTPDASQLRAIMTEIAESIPVVVVE